MWRVRGGGPFGRDLKAWPFINLGRKEKTSKKAILEGNCEQNKTDKSDLEVIWEKRGALVKRGLKGSQGKQLRKSLGNWGGESSICKEGDVDFRGRKKIRVGRILEIK